MIRKPLARAGVAAGALLSVMTMICVAQEDGESAKKYRGVIGANSSKIKKEGKKTLIWAGGGKPDGPDAKWYDFTDSLIPAEKLQFGIGKDRIRAIDDPLFVSPDDPRLLNLPTSPYRKKDKAASANDLQVIGYVLGTEARAYPVSLLDYHELVNDRIGGKPVTVGW